MSTSLSLRLAVLESKHLPGQHDQKAHGRLKSSEVRSTLADIANVPESQYRYGIKVAASIRRGEHRLAQHILKSYDSLADTNWGEGLSKDAQSLLKGHSIQEAINLFREKGLIEDADSLDEKILIGAMESINKSNGDGRPKVAGEIVSRSPQLKGAAVWLASALSSTVPVAPVTLKMGPISDCSAESINIGADSQDPGQFLVHEYGHWVAFNDPAAYSLTSSFLKSRAGPIVKIRDSDGQSYTEAYSDTFIDEYAGKIYSHSADEILSVGLQNMFAAPRNFLRTDPDHFFFTLDMMSGYNSTEPSEKSLAELESLYL